MQITINIDPNLPRWLKRVAMYAGVPAILVIATAVYANVDAPIFVQDEPLSSSKMTASFKTLTDAINALQAKLTADEVTITANSGAISALQTANTANVAAVNKNSVDPSVA